MVQSIVVFAIVVTLIKLNGLNGLNVNKKGLSFLSSINENLWPVIEQEDVLLDTIRTMNISSECGSAIDEFINGLKNNSLWAFKSEYFINNIQRIETTILLFSA